MVRGGGVGQEGRGGCLRPDIAKNLKPQPVETERVREGGRERGGERKREREFQSLRV